MRNCEGSKNSNWKGGRIKKSCALCGNSFHVYPYRSNQKCCSLVCANRKMASEQKGVKNPKKGLLGEKNPFYGRHHTQENKQKFSDNNTIRVPVTCEVCGDTVHRRPSVAKNQRTCSTKCRSVLTFSLSSQRTSIELKVAELLDQMGIRHISQHVVSKCCVDEFLPDFNVILEVHGDFWHGNPEVYGEGKQPLLEMQRKNRIRDMRRNKWLESKGFKVICVWEKDIKNNVCEAIRAVISPLLHSREVFT